MAQNEITELMRSFKELTGVGICFYDTERFFRYHENGEKDYMGHYCEFCKCVRLLKNGRLACEKSDKSEASELARDYGEPFFFKCHMGLCELVVPVMKNGRLLGLVFLGQCRVEGEDAVEDVKKAAISMGGDGERFSGLYEELPIMKRSDLLAMGNLFSLYFKKLGDVADFFGKEGLEIGNRPTLGRRIADYVERNYAFDISPRKISEHFYVNESYAARVFKSDIGMSLTEYIRKVRFDNAKRLLKNTSASVCNIALNVGYRDANYFTRLFSREFGETPTEYRNQKR